jgi:hypothetical protein
MGGPTSSFATASIAYGKCGYDARSANSKSFSNTIQRTKEIQEDHKSDGKINV